MTITMRFSQALILQILWTILIALTQSQIVRGQTCQPGWFGSNCQYKCHCKTSTCDADGMCADGVCEKGWFGPACQYVDFVASHTTAQTESWLKDGNSKTCNTDTTLQQITVNMINNIHFTWLRLQVQDPSLLQEFQITFLDSIKSSIGCKNMRNATVNKRTLDFDCDVKKFVQFLILTGKGVKSLCSLYISGGRNVALRQTTSQSSTYNSHFVAENAVDGNTDSDWTHGSCACTGNGDKTPTWNITFPREHRISRYVLYNTVNNKTLLRGFKITAFRNLSITSMTYTDREEGFRDVYTVLSTFYTNPVSLVSIQANSNIISQPLLPLCEVELYGDSVCPPSKYGRECQYTCNCAVKNEACFVSTGGCPSGCSPGFQGEGCNQPCDLDNIDGTCLHGCQSGYQIPNCDYDTLTVSALLNTSAAVYNFIMDVKTNGNISQDSNYNKLYRLDNLKCMKRK